MKNPRVLKSTFALVLMLFLIFFTKTNFAQAESVNVNLLVAVCNSNLICEDVIGENYGSCPSDCEAPPPPPPSTSTASSTSSGPGAGYTNPTSGSGSSTSGFPLNPNFPNNGSPVNNQNGANNNANTNTGEPGQVGTKGKPTPIRPPGSVPQSGIDGIIKIAPYTTSATLTFKTYLASLLNISWGTTGTYELGSMADSWYHQNFSKEITGLSPGTRYYYRLELLDSLGRKNEYEGQFMTASERSNAPLPVILNFGISTKRGNDSTILTWDIKPAKDTILSDIRKDQERRFNQNISLKDELNGITKESEEELAKELKSKEESTYVRLTRSDFSFPKDPFEGKVVYEGSGEQATDINLVDGNIYYYSIFIMNGKNEYSSPAIIKYIHKTNIKRLDGDNLAENNAKKEYDPLIQDKNQVDIEKWSDPDKQTGFCGQSESVQPTLSLKDTFSGISKEQKNGLAIQFIHDGQAILPHLGVVSADGREKLLIRVKSDRFEEGDKVGICIYSERDSTYTDYLLTKNADGTFELIFPAISTIKSGKSDYQFTIGMIKYNGAEMVLERGEISFFIPSERSAFNWLEMLIIVTILCLILWIGRRYRLFAIFNR